MYHKCARLLFWFFKLYIHSVQFLFDIFKPVGVSFCYLFICLELFHAFFLTHSNISHTLEGVWSHLLFR